MSRFLYFKALVINTPLYGATQPPPISNIDSAPRGGRYLKKYLITFYTFLCSDTSISAIIKTNRVFSLQPFLIFV